MPEQVSLTLTCERISRAELFVKALKRRGIQARQRDLEVHVVCDAAREADVRGLHEARYAE